MHRVRKDEIERKAMNEATTRTISTSYENITFTRFHSLVGKKVLSVERCRTHCGEDAILFQVRDPNLEGFPHRNLITRPS